jgi:hypothetical protein
VHDFLSYPAYERLALDIGEKLVVRPDVFLGNLQYKAERA